MTTPPATVRVNSRRQPYRMVLVLWLLAAAIIPAQLYADESRARDELNTFTDGREAVPIPESDRIWLKQSLAKGEIRPATESDKKAWIALAKEKHRKIDYFTEDYGHTFVILKSIEVQTQSGFVSFIIKKGVPFPKWNYGGSTFYNMNNGGWFEVGHYDDGSGEKIGEYPHKY